MSTTELLAGAGGSIKLIDEQILTASGNWTKAAAVKPTDRVIIQMWSGGGAGASSSNSQFIPGGQGGFFAELEFFAYELPSTVPCIVGSGGIANAVQNNNGGNGGASSFGGFSIPGGGGGIYNASSSGLLNLKADLLSGTSLTTDPDKGVGSYPNGYSCAPNPKVKIEAGGFWALSNIASAYYMNASDRVYAGAAGGGVGPGSSVLSSQTPKSIIGGAGGAAAPINTGANASNGSPPGGGGGAKSLYNSVAGIAGNGARGEIRVRVLRGAS